MNEQSQIEKFSMSFIKELECTQTNPIAFFAKQLNPDPEVPFEVYLKNLQATLKTCSCQHSWFSGTLSIRCFDCQLSPNSCICVSCFLKGKHKGHKVKIAHSINGTCDCGDPMNWKPAGFCSDHPGPEENPEMTQLDSETRIKLISMANALFHHYTDYAILNSHLFHELTCFIQKIVSLGDATRRCVCIGIRNSLQFMSLYSHIIHLDQPTVKLLTVFLGSLCNDAIFREYFAQSVIKSFPKILWFHYILSQKEDYTITEKSLPLQNASHFFKFTFHAFSKSLVQQLVKEEKIDFLEISSKSLNLIFSYLFANMNKTFIDNSDAHISFDRIQELFSGVLELKGKDDPDIQSFVQQFAINTIKREFSYPIVRELYEKKDDPLKVQSALFHVLFSLYSMFHKFATEKIYSIQPLKLLADFFKRTPFLEIDSKYANKESIDVHYRYLGEPNVEISQAFITHLLAFHSLNLKEKSLVDYIKEVTTDDVDSFLKNWALIPLRWVIAVMLYDLGVYTRNDSETLVALLSFRFKMNIEQSFVPSFAMIQRFMKTVTDVDSYLMMIISTFGLTSPIPQTDFDDQKMRYFLFSIFHFIVSLIFDTFCEENDMFSIRRLAFMSILIKNEIKLSELDNVWYGRILSDEKFLDDFQSFTTKTKRNNQTVFKLTDSSDWQPLLPFFHTNVLIDTITKLISDHPDTIIVNFPPLPKETEHILFSPVLYALEFYILSHRTCIDFKAIHQLIFRVLICQATLYNESNSDGSIEDLSIEATDFQNLIEKLKDITFPSFLRSTIKLSNNKPTSMISLLISLGNIGKMAISRMGLKDIQLPEETNDVDDKETKQIKKERSSHLKEKIILEFQNKQQQFSSSALIDSPINDTIECNVCHMDQPGDFLAYPALVFDNPTADFIRYKFKNYELGQEYHQQVNETIPYFSSRKSLRMCLHPVHNGCVRKNRQNFFECPADRCPRNALLPIITPDIQTVQQGFSEFAKVAYHSSMFTAVASVASDIEILEVNYRSNPSCLDKQAISLAFSSLYFMFTKTFRRNDILDHAEIRRRKKIIKDSLIKSLNEEFAAKNDYQKSLIWAEFKKLTDFQWDQQLLLTGTFEDNFGFVRQSIDESFCDFDNVPLDFSEAQLNDYLKNKNDKYLTPLMKYIALSLEFDEKNRSKQTDQFSYVNMQEFIKGLPKDDSGDLFSYDADIVHDLSSQYQLFTFLRCAAIFDHFVRSKAKFDDTSKLIDWDSILSISHLLELYNIKDHWLNVDLCESQNLPVLPLFDLPKMFLDLSAPPYNAPILDDSRGDMYMCLFTGTFYFRESVLSYLKVYMNDSFSIFLILNGKGATDVVVISALTSQIISLNSFYLDSLGDTDIGIQRGNLLYLSESKRDEIINNFLSGAWTDKLKFHPLTQNH